MKKLLKGFCILYTIITLVGGAITAGLLFSNDMLLFNCITDNQNKLRPVYNNAFENVNGYQYRELSINSKSNNNAALDATMKIYLDKESSENDNYYVIDVTIKQDNNVAGYKYQGMTDGGKIYLTSSEKPTVFIEEADITDLLNLVIFNKNIDNLSAISQSTPLLNFVEFKEIDMNGFCSALYDVKPVINIKETYLGVEFFFSSTASDSTYTTSMIIDSYGNIRQCLYGSSDTNINIDITNCSNTITLAAIQAK